MIKLDHDGRPWLTLFCVLSWVVLLEQWDSPSWLLWWVSDTLYSSLAEISKNNQHYEKQLRIKQMKIKAGESSIAMSMMLISWALAFLMVARGLQGGEPTYLENPTPRPNLYPGFPPPQCGLGVQDFRYVKTAKNHLPAHKIWITWPQNTRVLARHHTRGAHKVPGHEVAPRFHPA